MIHLNYWGETEYFCRRDCLSFQQTLSCSKKDKKKIKKGFKNNRKKRSEIVTQKPNMHSSASISKFPLPQQHKVQHAFILPARDASCWRVGRPRRCINKQTETRTRKDKSSHKADIHFRKHEPVYGSVGPSVHANKTFPWYLIQARSRSAPHKRVLPHIIEPIFMHTKNHADSKVIL